MIPNMPLPEPIIGLDESLDASLESILEEIDSLESQANEIEGKKRRLITKYERIRSVRFNTENQS